MIKICVTNLGKYNEGSLVYKWLALPCTEQELQDTYKSIGLNAEYEECFLTDWEIADELKGLIKIGEYSSIERLNNLAEEIGELDSWDLEVIGAICRVHSVEFEEGVNQVDNVHYIHLDKNCSLSDEENIAYSYIESVGDIECACGNMANYFDYESFGRDLSYELDYTLLSNEYDMIDEKKALLSEKMDELKDENYHEEINSIVDEMKDIIEEIEDITDRIEDIHNLSNYELAEWYIESFGDVEDLGNETLERYFNYESFGRDLLFDYAIDDVTYIAIA